MTKGMDLCEAFCLDIVEPLLREAYPSLRHTLGLVGYGSDVMGYDDEVSRDHMWGPRFYLFLEPDGLACRKSLHDLFCRRFPSTFHGFSVHFAEPDLNDNGIRTSAFLEEGPVSPLYWLHTPDGFLKEQLGTIPKDPFDWLSLSEQRLLGLTSGRLFIDDLSFDATRTRYKFYPDDVCRYLIASQWALISEERAFVRRCADVGDDIGSRLVCGRMAERLMRLCFLYAGKYAPYSKWFGTAFSRLDLPDGLAESISGALSANDMIRREKDLLHAQVLVAAIHNASGLTLPISSEIHPYFSRKIQVIDTDAFSALTQASLSDPLLRAAPLFGTFSQVGNFVHLSDPPVLSAPIGNLYRQATQAMQAERTRASRPDSLSLP